MSFSIWRGFGAPMRCLAFSMAVAMAMRASGIREGPEGHTTVTTCSERVAMVLDNVYGRWFARKIDQLLLDDPFSTSQDTKEDLLKRLQKSMLFHCEWLVTSTSLLKVAFEVFLNIFGVYGFAMLCLNMGHPKIPWWLIIIFHMKWPIGECSPLSDTATTWNLRHPPSRL